jgi:hypothetical protein
MLKDFMWNLFQKTGSIGSYMVYKEIEKKERSLFSELPVQFKVNRQG